MGIDRTVQERVLSALEFAPDVEAAQVGVSVHDGVVTLRGAVPTFNQKLSAERAAMRVYGVRAVANDLDVLPTHDGSRSDSAIAEAAANAIAWNSAIPSKAVQITVREGWITLTGTVEWRFQRDAAYDVLRRLYGVKGVTNAIAVAPKVEPADVQTKIENAFKRSAEVDAQHVHVEAKGGQVVLTGTVRSMTQRREAERAAWSAPGVILVDDRIAVAP